jgi:hypothetical protein
VERQPRQLTSAEVRIKVWIRRNHGVLSRVARQFNCSVTFVQRIAYNRDAVSKDKRIEKRLRALGCPLIQKV